MAKLLYGHGFNDLTVKTSQYDESLLKSLKPSYNSWHNMLKRCYGEKIQTNHPTYIGCTVCDEWLNFSSFHHWFEIQYKSEGWHLDKDLLIPGNKIYSPETCVFIPGFVNRFIIGRRESLSNTMMGVAWHNRDEKYIARCRNPLLNKTEYLGLFSDELRAHLAWKNRKHEIACQIAGMVSDERVASALKTRYL